MEKKESIFVIRIEIDMALFLVLSSMTYKGNGCISNGGSSLKNVFASLVSARGCLRGYKT